MNVKENDLTDDDSYTLSPEQEAELMISLEESYHEDNMLSVKESKKIHARWLNEESFS
jgi:hypothetical protein